MKEKMKNNIYTSMIFTVLLTGLNANAGAADTTVDNSVKYGEKYVCEITTTDQKKYTLDVEWNVEPAKYSTTPKWQEKLVYTLKLDSEPVDSGYFSDLGFGGGKTVLTFNYDKYAFSASEGQSTRIGTNFHAVNIELDKSYDNDGKSATALAVFNSFHSADRFYGSTKDKELSLDIQTSVCTVGPSIKD